MRFRDATALVFSRIPTRRRKRRRNSENRHKRRQRICQYGDYLPVFARQNGICRRQQNGSAQVYVRRYGQPYFHRDTFRQSEIHVARRRALHKGRNKAGLLPCGKNKHKPRAAFARHAAIHRRVRFPLFAAYLNRRAGGRKQDRRLRVLLFVAAKRDAARVPRRRLERALSGSARSLPSWSLQRTACSAQ